MKEKQFTISETRRMIRVLEKKGILQNLIDSITRKGIYRRTHKKPR